MSKLTLPVSQIFSMDIMRHKDSVDAIVKTGKAIMNSKSPEEKEILKVNFSFCNLKLRTFYSLSICVKFEGSSWFSIRPRLRLSWRSTVSSVSWTQSAVCSWSEPSPSPVSSGRPMRKCGRGFRKPWAPSASCLHLPLSMTCLGSSKRSSG